MLEFRAPRPHMHPPPASYQPLDGFRSSSFYNAGPYGAPASPRRLSTSRSSSFSVAAPDGLRTPPPDMAPGDYGISSYLPAANGHLRQFEPPVTNSGVPKMLDSFRTSAQSSQAHQQSKENYQAQPEPLKTRSTSSGASMTVPSTINSSKGNLAEFASQICCLFWFESSQILHQVAEQPLHAASPTGPLSTDANPTIGFRKWVTTILSTTQVSQNVILLALLFIYRLKRSNPTVRGKPGSEFRLFTVALMLGNKFLDDNTYTNKTWAEVSGINVQEIHIMEVEFLSNMRYSLFVGEAEWKDWHVKLGRFGAFWERAGRTTDHAARLPAPVAPSYDQTSSQLPSPPASTSSSPPYTNAHTPSSSGYAPYIPAHSQPQLLNPPHLPYTPTLQPDFDSIPKKRPSEYAHEMQPQAKRPTRSAPSNLSVIVPNFSTQLPVSGPPASVAIPPLQPIEPFPMGMQCSPSTSLPPVQQNQLPLPGTRSLSVSYSQTSQPLTITTMSNLSPYSSRQTSPYSHDRSIQHSATSSPTTPNYGSQSSPTYFLGNRNSPYRPVRAFNTLLVPPPSNTAQAQHLEAQALGYHTLAKTRPQYKTGLVPYMHPETSWTQSWVEPASFYR